MKVNPTNVSILMSMSANFYAEMSSISFIKILVTNVMQYKQPPYSPYRGPYIMSIEA